ncbi:MAG: hypothetical protein M9916_05005 [Crocinitomicaceae bacterium]|nr:hypothetical protein [Crocinitomicaceae bacterium]
MKKNSIEAFADKKTVLDKITGGYYTQDTVYTNGSDDCETITEPGDKDQYGHINGASWNLSDGIEVFDLVAPNPGWGVPMTPIRTR